AKAVDTGKVVDRIRDAQLDIRDATLDSLLTKAAFAFGVVGMFSVGFGWLAAGRALQPLQLITDTAKRVAGRNLQERIALAGPRDEVKELADTFDAMLERLDQAFAGQQRFIANASHELRTPLAINRTVVEAAASGPNVTPELRQLCTVLLEVNVRHDKLIEGLLTLFRSENEVASRLPVDLADIADTAVKLSYCEPETPAAGIDIRLDAQPAVATGDPTLLERMTLNLVQNAILHNTPGGGWVSVATGPGPRLVVTNTGPVVPRHEILSLTEPFRRLDNDRISHIRGSGLGLSIVASIVRAHNGRIDIEPRDGGGLIVTVSLENQENVKF
ncbi:MAG: sensor histidine kinase, partial [Mycobacteriales bacterium]